MVSALDPDPHDGPAGQDLTFRVSGDYVSALVPRQAHQCRERGFLRAGLELHIIAVLRRGHAPIQLESAGPRLLEGLLNAI